MNKTITLTRERLLNMSPIMRNSIIGLGVFLIGFPGYLLANHLTAIDRATTLYTKIDHLVPFIPETVLIYTWVYFFLFLPVFIIKDMDFFIQVGKAFMFIAAVSVAIFVIYPVKMNRPDAIDQSRFLEWGLALTYLVDKPLNCFPSMHVSNAFMASFAVMYFSRRVGVSALVVAILISISTLTAKQHYMVDVMGGLIIALAADYYFLRAYFKKNKLSRADKKEMLLSEWNALYVALIYGLFIAFVFILYMTGVKIPVDLIVF